MGFVWLGFWTSLSFSSLQIRDPKGNWLSLSLSLYLSLSLSLSLMGVLQIKESWGFCVVVFFAHANSVVVNGEFEEFVGLNSRCKWGRRQWCFCWGSAHVFAGFF